jgi:hypothetical protein
MFGKGSLLLVLGFSMMFMVSGVSFNNMMNSTIDNYSKYYFTAKCRYLADAGVNIINNRLWKNASVPDNTFKFSLDGGSIVDSLVTIDSYHNIKKLVSIGSYTLGDGTVYSTTVKVIIQPSLFSKFAYFSNSEGGTIYWTTKDSVFGPFHTNDNLNVNGNPVFMNDVSIGGSVNKANGSSDHPQFFGDLQTNVQITIPDTGATHVSKQATAGSTISGHSLVYFEFRGDSVRYRYSTSGSYTYQLLSTFAPTGVVYFHNAEVHVFGTVKGNYSIVADGTSGNQGSIYLDNDIVYNSNPLTNSASTDMLGIVAQNNVWVTDNTNNNTNGITIQAAVYCQTGSFGAQDYNTRPYAGAIRLLGGITQKTRAAVGVIGSNGSISNGFNKSYHYDSRLLTSYPPAFPGCGSFEIVSWYE